MIATLAELVARIPAGMPRMGSVVVARPGRAWTSEDLLALASDERHFELVRGDLYMMSPASPVQGRYAARLVEKAEDYLAAWTWLVWRVYP